MSSQTETDSSAGSGNGKKVFLLHPHSVIREELMDILIMNGFETYTLHDHKKALNILERFSGSIMFINIDEGMPEKEWEAYIKALQENPKTKDTRLGILSYNQDKALMQKYLMDITVPCGYIQLKLGVQESTKIIINALEANEARGRRQCIRADCEDDISSSLNFKRGTDSFYGKILDISSAGVAVKFDKIADVPRNTLLKEVQLRLRGGLVMTDMILMGQRADNRQIFIMLFAPAMGSENKLIVHRYIKQCLQRYINGLKV